MYQITKSVLAEIESALVLPEMGGILGIDKTKTVVKFYHDSTGRSTAHRYFPNIETLNKVIAEWYNAEINFIGFVHSHRAGLTKLSPCDLRYSEKIKSFCRMNEILMLLYIPDAKTFYQYVL